MNNNFIWQLHFKRIITGIYGVFLKVNKADNMSLFILHWPPLKKTNNPHSQSAIIILMQAHKNFMSYLQPFKSP